MKRLTIESIKDRCYSMYSDEYVILNNYYDKCSSKIEVYHDLCKSTWFITVNNFLNKKRKCPSCYGNKKLTIEIIKNRCYDLHGDEYLILSDVYVNNCTKILIKHNKCLNEWYVTPSDFLNSKSGCPACSKNKKLTIEDVSNRLLEYGYLLLSEYKNADTKIKIKHELCGYIYNVKPYNFFSGKRCPNCFRKKTICTKGELKIENFLNKNDVKYERQYIFKNCKLKNNLYFDFYLADHNICIEYDGIQHFESIDFFGGYDFLEKQKSRDLIKNKYCYENNITLIRISYLEYEKINNILQILLK